MNTQRTQAKLFAQPKNCSGLHYIIDFAAIGCELSFAERLAEELSINRKDSRITFLIIIVLNGFSWPSKRV